jgi:hypothetical protein
LELLARHAAVLFVQDVIAVGTSSSVNPSEVEGSRDISLRLLRGFPRLRFAPLGMTERQ